MLSVFSESPLFYKIKLDNVDKLKELMEALTLFLFSSFFTIKFVCLILLESIQPSCDKYEKEICPCFLQVFLLRPLRTSAIVG